MQKQQEQNKTHELDELEDTIKKSSLMFYEYKKILEVWKGDTKEDRNYLLEWILNDGIDYVYMKVVEHLMLTEKEYDLLKKEKLSMKDIYYLTIFDLDLKDLEEMKKVQLTIQEYTLIKKLRTIDFPRKLLLTESIMKMTEKLCK